MADSYAQGSFAFTCSHAELALIEQAFEASYAFMAEESPGDPSPELLVAFPPREPDHPWSGFLAIFPDPDFPDFGVEFEDENTRERPEVSTVFLYSTSDFQPDALAQLVRLAARTRCGKRPSALNGPAVALVPERANSGAEPA